MDWRGREGSSNVEDRRGRGMKGAFGGLGIAGIIVYLVLSLMGVDVGPLLTGGGPSPGQPQQQSQPYQETAEEKELRQFASVVLKDTEDVWTKIFQDNGLKYTKPILVIYTGATQSACGTGQSAMGPFYCPADTRVYLDLNFYNDLHNRFKAPGDFAMAYVIAHEVGHHVQNQVGTMDKVMALRSRMSEKEFNQYMVRLELQADYYAGVWAKHVQGKGYLEKGDLEEAINAASAVGDDRLQKQTRGYVTPDSFTHGTSEQRMRWFKRGFERGTLQGGNTFTNEAI